MPSTLTRLSDQGLSVSAEDRILIPKLERYGVWMIYVVLSSACFLFLSIIAPYAEGAWKLPALMLFVSILIWQYFTFRLGRKILQYEDGLD